MRPNENVARDLAYQQMIYNKLLELDTRMANLYPYTNLNHNVLEGGTRIRNHPLPGVSISTFEPGTLAVGGNQDDFLNNLSKRKPIGLPKPGKPQIQRPPIHPLRMNSTNATIPLTAGGMNNRIEIVKKIMKEKGLTLPQASKFVKENNLYKKAEKVVKIVGSGTKSGKISRSKKAKKWTDYAVHTANDGLDLAKKGMDIFGFGEVPEDFEGSGNKNKKISRIKKAKKWTDYAVHTANDGLDLAKKGKKIFGFDMSAGAKRPPSKWIMYVKSYASKHNISYKDALKQAGPSYRNSK